jgi:hypothetical protein
VLPALPWILLVLQTSTATQTTTTPTAMPPPVEAPSPVHATPYVDRDEILIVGGIGHRQALPVKSCFNGVCQTAPADFLDVVELGVRGRWLPGGDVAHDRWGLTAGIDTNQFTDVRASAGGALVIPLTTPTILDDTGQRLVFELEATAAVGRPRGVTAPFRAGLRARAAYGLFIAQDSPLLRGEAGGFVEVRDDTGKDWAVVVGLEMTYAPTSL